MRINNVCLLVRQIKEKNSLKNRKVKENMAKQMIKKNFVECMKGMGIIKRTLNEDERKDILRIVKNVYPKGGEKALDLAVSLSVMKCIDAS